MIKLFLDGEGEGTSTPTTTPLEGGDSEGGGEAEV